MQILASGSYDDTIKLYIDDPSDDWYDFQTLTGHASTVWSLAFSPSGDCLASASDDLTIRIWRRVEKYKWEEGLVVRGHDRSIYSISWGKGRAGEGSLGWLASVGGDGRINVWDIRVRRDHPLSIDFYSTQPFANLNSLRTRVPSRRNSSRLSRMRMA